MAQIRNVGAGIRTSGKVDGLVYVHVNGRTYARALPIFPAGMFKTPEAKKRQALFTLVQWHMKYHSATIKKCFSKGKFWSAQNNYHHRNAKAFREALDSLADNYVQGMKVSMTDIEDAIANYASANPDTIQIGGLDGYQPIYLNGPWPESITFTNGQGATTTVVIVDGSNSGSNSDTPGSGTTTPQQVTLTTVANPSNGGTITGAGTYAKDAQVTLKATAASGYSFSRWNDGNTNAQRTVTASADATYTAEFTQTSGGNQGGYDSGN